MKTVTSSQSRIHSEGIGEETEKEREGDANIQDFENGIFLSHVEINPAKRHASSPRHRFKHRCRGLCFL